MEEKIIEDAWRDFVILMKANQQADDAPWNDDEIEIMRLCWQAGSRTMFRQVENCLRKNDQARFKMIERQLQEFAAA